MGISIHNTLRDLCDPRSDGLYIPGILRRLLDPVFVHQCAVIFLTLAHRIPDRYDLVFLHIYHGIFLHQPRVIFQGYKIRRFPGNIKEQGEGRRIMEILHLPFSGRHRRCLRCAFNLIEPRLHGPLVHEHKSHIGLVACDRCDTRIDPHIVVDRKVIISVRCVQAVLLSEHAVEKPVL